MLQEYPFELVQKELEAALNEVKVQKKDKEEQMTSIFESTKKALMRSVEKTYKRFSNNLSGQFDSLVHSLEQLIKELEAKNALKVFRLESMLRYAHKVTG